VFINRIDKQIQHIEQLTCVCCVKIPHDGMPLGFLSLLPAGRPMFALLRGFVSLLPSGRPTLRFGFITRRSTASINRTAIDLNTTSRQSSQAASENSFFDNQLFIVLLLIHNLHRPKNLFLANRLEQFLQLNPCVQLVTSHHGKAQREIKLPHAHSPS
jgi:hypothetical protein